MAYMLEPASFAFSSPEDYLISKTERYLKKAFKKFLLGDYLNITTQVDKEGSAFRNVGGYDGKF